MLLLFSFWRGGGQEPPKPADETITGGVPSEYLLSRILDKVALYEAAHAALTGKRQALEDAIKALPEGYTVADLIAIAWS